MPYNNILYATEQEARNYYLTPSSQALFMDPSAPTFYFKTVDAFGQPDFIIADFTIRTPQQNPQDNPPLTRADLDTFRAEILALIATQQPQGGNAHESVDQSLNASTNN